MTPRALAPLALAVLVALASLAPQAASAQDAAGTYMRAEGVKAANKDKQPLGPDAFPIMGFDVSVESDLDAGLTGGASPTHSKAKLGDVTVNLSISGPALSLWQASAAGTVLKNVSLAVVDAGGNAIYRADLEQVSVRSLAMQSLGGRSAAVAVLSYARIRLSQGGTTVAWDRTKNEPWK
jgi:hypothetical protein